MRRLLATVFVLAALWTGVWFAAGLFVDARIDDILAREAQRGRAVVCADRARTGFPFAFRITCRSLALEARAPARPFALSAGPSDFGVSLDAPLTLVARIGAPLEIRAPDREPVRLDFQSAQVTVRMDGRRAAEARLLATGLRLANAGEAGPAAGRLELTLRSSGAAGPPDTIVAALRASGVAIPGADRLSRNTAPIDASADAKLSGLSGIFGLPPLLALDRWRRAGGRIDIASVAITKADAELLAAGTLALDDQRRLMGRIAGTGKGLPLARNEPQSRMGEWAARLGAVAANVRVPYALTFDNGVAKLGPVKIADLPPLY